MNLSCSNSLMWPCKLEGCQCTSVRSATCQFRCRSQSLTFVVQYVTLAARTTIQSSEDWLGWVWTDVIYAELYARVCHWQHPVPHLCNLASCGEATPAPAAGTGLLYAPCSSFPLGLLHARLAGRRAPGHALPIPHPVDAYSLQGTCASSVLWEVEE